MTQNQQYWQSAIQKWTASGLSQAEFCRQNNIKPRRFYAWKNRLQPATPALSSCSQPFVEVSPAVTTDQPGPVVMSLAGVEIHYDQNTSPELLIRLLKLLREEL
jgi:hypothetical protein